MFLLDALYREGCWWHRNYLLAMLVRLNYCIWQMCVNVYVCALVDPMVETQCFIVFRWLPPPKECQEIEPRGL